jgi:hypothetical protein
MKVWLEFRAEIEIRNCFLLFISLIDISFLLLTFYISKIFVLVRARTRCHCGVLTCARSNISPQKDCVVRDRRNYV